MLTDAELRHATIGALTRQTDRDRQSRIGASNLSNGCDYCLASNLLGDMRETAFLKKTWVGRVLGTAFHGILEGRVDAFGPNAVAERHVVFCHIDGYGDVGGTIDLDLGDQIVDWKGSTRKKLCLLIDYVRKSSGLEPVYGRTHKDVKLSERDYAAEMEKMAFKVHGYFGQATLYMHGSGRKRASLVFLNRDGTGYFDVPTEARYDDETAVHDVHVLSFNYDQAYAEALINRGQFIWDKLQAGATPSDFPRHSQCFPCSMQLEEAAKAKDVPAVEATFGAAA